MARQPTGGKPGRPKNEVKVQKDMAETLKLLTQVVQQQGERQERADKAIEKLTSVLENQPSPTARTAPEFFDFEESRRASDLEVVAIFKSRTIGYRQVLQRSRKLRKGDGDFEIVPGIEANFTNATWFCTDEEQAEMMREAIKYKERKKLVKDIIEVTGEEFEILKKGRQVEAVVSTEVTDKTSPAEILGVSELAS